MPASDQADQRGAMPPGDTLTADDRRRYAIAETAMAGQRTCADCGRWFSDPDLYGHTIYTVRGLCYCWECVRRHGPTVPTAVRRGTVNGAQITVTEGYALGETKDTP